MPCIENPHQSIVKVNFSVQVEVAKGFEKIRKIRFTIQNLPKDCPMLETSPFAFHNATPFLQNH